MPNETSSPITSTPRRRQVVGDLTRPTAQVEDQAAPADGVHRPVENGAVERKGVQIAPESSDVVVGGYVVGGTHSTGVERARSAIRRHDPMMPKPAGVPGPERR